MPKGEGKQIEPGLVDRVVSGVRYAISGVKPSDWFGPSQPLQPVAPPDVAGRKWDYPVGINFRYTPRGDEGISFGILRALADKHDITRLAIETRKDQVGTLEWGVRMKDKKAKPDEAKLAKARKLLEYPDGLVPFSTWISQLMEEVLVVDAACIEPRKSLNGDLARLDLIDGTTITPMVDEKGRTPDAPNPAYQQVLHGVPAGNFSRDELLYFPRRPRVNKRYGLSPVEQIFVTINIALRRQASILQFYTEGNIPEAILMMPEGWTAQQIKEFDEWFNALMSGNMAQRRKMKFVPGGKDAQLIETQKTDLKDMFDEWLARIVCFCFSISPTALMAQTNRATAETVEQTAKDEGLIPLLKYLESAINLLLSKWGGMADLEFRFKRDDDQDPLKKAQADDYAVRNGTKSIDEVREEAGLEPIGIGHGIITAAGWEPLPTEENKTKYADIFEAKEQARLAFAQSSQEGQEDEDDPDGDEDPPKGKKPVPEPASNESQGVQKIDGEPAAPVEPLEVAKVQKKKTVKLKVEPDNVPADVEHQLANTIANFLQAQGIKASRVMSRTYERLNKLEKVEGESRDDIQKKASPLVEEVLESLDTDNWAILIEPTKKALREVAMRGAAGQLQRLQISDEDALSQADEKAIAYAEKRSAALVGKRIVAGKIVTNPDPRWAITQSTRNMLRSTVTSAVEEGWSAGQLASSIMDNQAFSRERAMNIARTELGDAHMAGNRAAWAEAGAKRKRVLLGSEHKEPDECSVNAAQGWIPFDEAYSSGHQHPLFHPGCVCDEEVELEGEDLGGEMLP